MASQVHCIVEDAQNFDGVCSGRSINQEMSSRSRNMERTVPFYDISAWHAAGSVRAIAQCGQGRPQLDEGFRHQLVEAYHRRQRIRFPNARMHAAFHVVVENQLAFGEEAVLDTLAPLCRDGLTRHDAIYAIASVLVGHVYDIATGRGLDPTA